MILYSITYGPRGYMLAKFDEDFNVAAVYNVNTRTCDCPAGPRPTCKHRKMLPRMLGKVDSGEFYCYETQTWHQPFGDLTRPEAGDLAGREALPDAGEAVHDKRPVTDVEPGSLSDLILNGNPELEGKLTGLFPKPSSPQPAPTIRRR